MELYQYVRILQKRWWIILVAMVATALSAYIFSSLQVPVYQSVVEVVIQPARADLGLTQSTKTLMRSYMTVADSNSWAQEVINRLRLDMEPQTLRSNARFAAEDDRLVIRIEIEDTDGEQANRIAQEWANLVLEWRDSENQRQRKEDRVYALLRDAPTYSQSWPPRTPIVLIAGAVLGLLIALIIIFLLEWLESGTIRTPGDIARWLNITVLGAIPPADSRG